MRLGPVDMGNGLRGFSDSIIALFKQQMQRPFWNWTAPTSDLPTTSDLGANKGAQGYDTTLNTITWFDGTAWQSAISLTYGDARYVLKAGDTMTGALILSYNMQANSVPQAVDAGSLGAGSGGVFRLRTSAKPTASGQRLGVLQFSAPDSAAAIQNAAAIEAFATEDWGTLAGEGTELRFGATANTSTSRTMALVVTAQGAEPVADDTFYLGRNSNSAPRSWKGLVMRDQVTGTRYRIEILSGIITATAL